MSENKEIDSLRVAVCGDAAMVRVGGRGSFKMGSSLKGFATAAFEQRGCRRLLFDMEECVTMDSTFMGVIAGLALRLRRAGSGRVALINLSPKTSALLETLGLNRLIDAYGCGDAPQELGECLGRLREMPAMDLKDDGKDKGLERMLTAHEDLVRAAPENSERFRDVIGYLRKDMDSAGDRNDA
jgi:anti-anti-sigma factor